MYRKLRDPYAAVLKCSLTDMDQTGGRKGLSVLAFFYSSIISAASANGNLEDTDDTGRPSSPKGIMHISPDT